MIAWPGAKGRGIVAAILLAAAGDAAAQVAPAPSRQWNLDGAGGLDFPAGDPAIAALGPRLAAQGRKLALTFDAQGRVVKCTSALSAMLADDVTDVLCAALVRTGRFQRNSYLEIPADSDLVATASASPRYRAALPIRLGTSGPGTSVTLTEAADGTCRVRSLALADGFEAEICAAWRGRQRPAAAPDGSGRRETLIVATDGAAAPTYVIAIGGTISRTGPVESTLPPPGESERLTPAQGQPSIAIGSDDYPTRALRDGVAGRVKVWIAFNREGKPVRCRPVSSTNSVFLANATCALMMRRARFAYAADASPFEGARYWQSAINWVLP